MISKPMGNAEGQVSQKNTKIIRNLLLTAAGSTQIEAAELGTFKEIFKEIGFERDLLSDNLIGRRIKIYEEDARLGNYMQPGYRCCPVLIPFDEFLPLSPEAIENGEHFYVLLISPSGETLEGFSDDCPYIFNTLPPEMQALAFVIPPCTAEDRSPFINELQTACDRLKVLFS